MVASGWVLTLVSLVWRYRSARPAEVGQRAAALWTRWMAAGPAGCSLEAPLARFAQAVAVLLACLYLEPVRHRLPPWVKAITALSALCVTACVRLIGYNS